MAYINVDMATEHLVRLGQADIWLGATLDERTQVLELASARLDALSLRLDCGAKITPRWSDGMGVGLYKDGILYDIAVSISLLSVWYLENPNIQISLVSGAANGEEISTILSPDLIDLPYFVKNLLKDYLTPASILGEPDRAKGRAISYK